MSAVAPAEIRTPAPDKTAIAQALTTLFESEDVIELRAFHKRRKRTDAGYFDAEHRDKLVDEARRLSAAGAAVYVTLNRIDPQLLSRYANRIQEHAASTATDANITRRRWLLLDFDPIRPKDTSATDAQVELAKDITRRCYQALRDAGWPEPVIAESGNGMHLVYPLDLANDAESRELIKGALGGLARRFDTMGVTLDQSVFNAGRILKLYGTVATKGDNTPAAPWRESRLKSTPARGEVITPEQLRALHPPTETRNTRQAPSGQSFDLDSFLARLGIGYTHDTHEGSDRHKLDHCPFNADHGKGEAAIFRRPGGAIGFKCQHNGCADKRWEHVRALVDGARETRQRLNGHAKSQPTTTQENVPHAIITCAADVTPEPIRWLWPGRIAIGKLSIIAGDPGLGKSMVTIAVAAHVTRGTPWPVDLAPCLTGDVLMLSAEDDLADTIRPRLDAAGADVRRVHVLTAVRDRDRDTGEPTERGVSLRRDVARLATVLDGLPNCRMVVIDPISAYLDGTDSHTNADVRGLLAPLTDLAARYRVAIVAVTHLRKGEGRAIYRAIGSIAFAAAARFVAIVTKDPQDETRRLVLPAKNNLGPDTAGLAYSITATPDGVPSLEWGAEAVTITADDALSPIPTEDARTERDAAAEWLRDVLADGPMPARDVRRQADEAGHSWATVRRAQSAIGVQVARDGFGRGGRWRWALAHRCSPDSIDAQDKTLSTYGAGEHLCGKPERSDSHTCSVGAHPDSVSAYGAGEHLWTKPGYTIIPRTNGHDHDDAEVF